MAKKKSNKISVTVGGKTRQVSPLEYLELTRGQQQTSGPAQLSTSAQDYITGHPEIQWGVQQGITGAGPASQFLQNTLGIPKSQADSMYSKWLQTKYEATKGLAQDPGDLSSFAQGQGGAGGALDPTARSAYLAKVFMPFQQQQAAQLQSQIGDIGNQFSAALKQYGGNLPPGYANMYNLNNLQSTKDAQLMANAGFSMANAMNNPAAQQAISNMQAQTAAANKAYMEQRTALSNALSTSAGGGLGGLVAGSAAAGSTLPSTTALPQVANVTQPKTTP